MSNSSVNERVGCRKADGVLCVQLVRQPRLEDQGSVRFGQIVEIAMTSSRNCATEIALTAC